VEGGSGRGVDAVRGGKVKLMRRSESHIVEQRGVGGQGGEPKDFGSVRKGDRSITGLRRGGGVLVSKNLGQKTKGLRKKTTKKKFF